MEQITLFCDTVKMKVVQDINGRVFADHGAGLVPISLGQVQETTSQQQSGDDSSVAAVVLGVIAAAAALGAAALKARAQFEKDVADMFAAGYNTGWGRAFYAGEREAAFGKAFKSGAGVYVKYFK